MNEFDLPEPTFVPWLGRKVEHPEGYGIYFQQRWDEALQANPQFLYINDWNEWTAGKYPPTEASPPLVSCAATARISSWTSTTPSSTAAIQPMKGGYTDNYYMQMAENIRRYKGVRPIPELRGLRPIKIDGQLRGLGRHRGRIPRHRRRHVPPRLRRLWRAALHQRLAAATTSSPAKSPWTRTRCYFYAETKDPLTPHTGTNWMLLLIDADQNPDTGWYGYDYLINKRVVDRNTRPRSCAYAPGATAGLWVEVARLDYRYAGNALGVGRATQAAWLEWRRFHV